jgi:hypothetical protein
MLKLLLQQSRNCLEIFQLYVVAADFKKMLARMNHPVSTLYLTCFQQMKSGTFEHINVVPTKHDENDQLFLDDIPILAKFANMKIPNLEKMAQAAKEMAPFNFYNKDTYMEFHELLCELLERFHQSLKDLKDFQKSKVKKGKEAGWIGQSDQEEIVKQLQKVVALGRALRGIVRGRIIMVHLKTIDRIQVMEKNGKFWPMTHESEDDAEFRLQEPYSTKSHDKPLLPWESFHDWLKLMVHHFDAIHVLDSHLMSLNLPSPIDISIKILYPSLPDEHMLPWCQGFTKLHSGRVRTDSGRRDLKNILIAIPSRTTSDPSWEASAW